MNDDALRDELLRRAAADQTARMELDRFEAGRRAGAGSTAEEEAVWDRIREIDRDNTAWLTSVVDAGGWPKRSRVGDEAANAAWLLVQHAGAGTGFQARCLALMEAAPPSEVDPVNLAYLTDRVRLGQGEPQVYGTQVVFAEGEWLARELADPDAVDARRAAVGMGPLEEYLRHFRAGSASSDASRSADDEPV